MLFYQPNLKQKVIEEITGVKSKTSLPKYIKELIKLVTLHSKVDDREVFYIKNDLLKSIYRNKYSLFF